MNYNSLILLFFISIIFPSGFNAIELSYGTPSGEVGTLSEEQYDGDYTINLTLQKYKGNHSSFNYFIEYNKFELNILKAKYEMYLLGVGYQVNQRLTRNLLSNIGLSLGISDDQYKIYDKYFLTQNGFDRGYTHDDSGLFVRLTLGLLFKLNNKASIGLKYNYTFTNEQYGLMDMPYTPGSAFEDERNIEYSSALVGINFKFFNKKDEGENSRRKDKNRNNRKKKRFNK